MLCQNQHRPSTKDNYLMVWRQFNEFFIKLDFKPRNWEDRLTLFVAYLIKNKKQSSTVKSYISAVKAVLKMNRIKVTGDQYLLSSMVRACRLKNDRVKTRLPIGKKMLIKLLQQIEKSFSQQPYLRLLYQTMLSTMYHGLLRIREVTCGPHNILAKDVQIADNKKKFRLILRSSKTHGEYTNPQIIKVSATGGDAEANEPEYMCPYKLLRAYSQYRGPYQCDMESFFTLPDRVTLVKSAQLNACLKKIIKKSGYNSNHFRSHSFRIGRSCDLFKLGLLVETIKKIRRWKSNTVYHYLKM